MQERNFLFKIESNFKRNLKKPLTCYMNLFCKKKKITRIYYSYVKDIEPEIRPDTMIIPLCWDDAVTNPVTKVISPRAEKEDKTRPVSQYVYSYSLKLIKFFWRYMTHNKLSWR